VLIEEPPPLVEDPPVLLVELERPQRPRTTSRRASMTAGSVAVARADAAATLTVTAAEAEPSATPSAEAEPPAVDPQWRVDPRKLDSWRLTEGVPEWGWGRAYRACKGLGSEHMTDEEKDRCHGGWSGGPRDGRPSPGFIGPIRPPDKIYVPSRDPPSRYDKDADRQQRCRDERRRRVPGNLNEKHLDFTGGSPAPSLLEGGCF
jgi:hypothetical protein